MLSFLVISILVVMLICSCYGLCKLPCKRTTTAPRDGRPRRNNPMIPLPPPEQPAGAIKTSTSSSFQQGGKTSTVNKQLPPRLQLGRNHTLNSYTDGGDRRRDSLSPSRYSAPPANLSNVVHLGQLQSHSFHSDLEQYAVGSANVLPPSYGRQGGRPLTHQIHHGYQQRSELDPESHRQITNVPRTINDPAVSPQPSPFQARTVDVPPPYLRGTGYPYTPCKSPRTVDDLSHDRRLSGSRHHHHHRNSQGRNSVRSAGESELTDFDIDTMTEGDCNSIVSERVRHDDTTAPPQGYSTEV